MTREHELGVIGAGNMAEAIVRGVLEAGVLPAEGIVASDPDAGRRRHFADELHVACEVDNAAPAGCPRVLLAIKPQVMGDVLDGIAVHVHPDALVISIAAGIATSFLDARLGGRGRLVRVMPNTPMLAGAGMAAVAAGPRATDADVQWVRRLFAARGQALVVDEGLMDAVTAVSGSGPAYFFYLIEAMVEAGVAEGLPVETASELACGTCAGAAALLKATRETPQALRARVTSPGGTTQRAIETLDAAGVKGTLVAAVRAAAQRSRELGR